MKNGRMQAKDIPEQPILDFLAGPYTGWSAPGWACSYPGYPNSITQAMPPGVPGNLVLAKMRAMISKGLIKGCACGCRGDFRLPDSDERAAKWRAENPNDVPWYLKERSA